MTDYESLAHLSRWRRLVIWIFCFAISSACLAQQPPGTKILYRCKDADGVTNYTSQASVGCVVISFYRPALAPSPASPQPTNYRCTSDCSGHRAGYEWARNRSISDPYQCTGNSQSFIEGCRAFTEGHPGY